MLGYHRTLSCAALSPGQDLKAKSRIFVPDSALLHGVMDEEDVLNYGEVS